MDLLAYYRRQSEEQKEVIEQKEKIIKLLQKENYELKQDIYEKLSNLRDLGESNDIHKNIRMLDILETLINDLYYDIQEELED